MKNIPFLTEAIYCNIFRWLYLRKEKYFLNFFVNFRNLDSVLNIKNNKMTLIADVFSSLLNPKNVVR